MKQLHTNNMFAIVCQLQEIEKTKYEFNFALIEIKKKIKLGVEEYNEKVAILQNELRDLLLQYCEKNNQGEAIIINNTHQGLLLGQQPEYDKRVIEIGDEINKLQKEELGIDLSGVKIPKGVLPATINGLQQEYLQPYIIDEK